MKTRLDIILAERGYFQSRERAKAAIMSGAVFVNGQLADKPGMPYSESSEIEVRENPCPYVSRGGLKLEKALNAFQLDPAGLTIIDGGASTGGFTDCLLRHGAAKVWAVDVGYGQLAWSLRNDARVCCVERMNLRNLTLEHIGGELCDMAVLDLSFISLKLILANLGALIKRGSSVAALVKPQFEAGREKVAKGGVVKSPAVHKEVLEKHIAYAEAAGFGVMALTHSPIKGPKGNIEFLSHLTLGEEAKVNSGVISRVVDTAHEELS